MRYESKPNSSCGTHLFEAIQINFVTSQFSFLELFPTQTTSEIERHGALGNMFQRGSAALAAQKADILARFHQARAVASDGEAEKKKIQ